jgi:hypothetical protein
MLATLRDHFSPFPSDFCTIVYAAAEAGATTLRCVHCEDGALTLAVDDWHVAGRLLDLLRHRLPVTVCASTTTETNARRAEMGLN